MSPPQPGGRPGNPPPARVPAPLLRAAATSGRVPLGALVRTIRQAAAAEMAARGWARRRRRAALAHILRFLRVHRRRRGLPPAAGRGEALALLYRDVLGIGEEAVEKVTLSEKFGRLEKLWHPGIVARVNDTHVKVARVEGEFEWHRHPDADELFLVRDGRLRIDFRDRDPVWLAPGELVVVPRGVEHRPVAPETTELLLVEPAGTVNTGDARSDRTVGRPGWI